MIKKEHYKTINIFCVFVLLLLTWITYRQVLHFEFLNYDDPSFITQNKQVLNGLGLQQFLWSLTYVGELNLWHPFTWFSYQLDATIWGVNPSGFHLTNMALHAFMGVAVFFLIREFGFPSLIAFSIAVIFQLHPSSAQTVCWISERKGILSSLAIVICLLTWMKWLSSRDVRLYLIVFIAGLVAYLSKPVAVVLPVLMIVCFYYRRKTLNTLWNDKNARCIVLFFAICSLALSILTIYLQKEGGLSSVAESTMPFSRRLLLMPQASVYYFKSAFSGVDHRLLVPPPADSYLMSSLVFSVVSLVFVWVLFWKCKKAALFYMAFLTLFLPVSGLVSVSYYYVADRYMYLGRLFLWLTTAQVLMQITESKKSNGVNHAWNAIACSFLLFAFASLPKSSEVISRYKNSETLFAYEYQQIPFSMVAYLQYAHALRESKKYEKAEKVLLEAIMHSPETSYDAHLSLGALLHHQGDVEKSMMHFLRATTSHPVSNATAHQNLAIHHAQNHRYEKAREIIHNGLKIFPRDRILNELKVKLK